MVFERKILFPQRWSKYLPCEDEARVAHADGRKKQLVELSMESKVILNMQHISPTMICPISKIYNLLPPRYLKTCNHWLEKAQKEYNQKLGVEVNVTIFISASLLSYVEVQSDKAHYLVVSFILSFCQLLRAAK